jgi:actin-related protein
MTCDVVMQAVAHSKSYQINYPIKHGLIENWNNMERLWQRCFFDHLRVEPEEHYVLLVSANQLCVLLLACVWNLLRRLSLR